MLVVKNQASLEGVTYMRVSDITHNYRKNVHKIDRHTGNIFISIELVILKDEFLNLLNLFLTLDQRP